MEQTEITSYVELLERIRFLKVEKLNIEEKIKKSLLSLVFDFNLVSLVRDSANGYAKDSNVFSRLVHFVLTMARTFIVGRLIGKRRCVKEFLSLLFANK